MATDRTRAFLEGSHAQQVAILTLQGDTEQSIADQLNLSKKQVQGLKKKEEYWAALKEETETICKALRARFQKKLEGAETPAWDTFMYHLKDKKTLDAVRMYVELIGFKAKETEAGDGAPAITIVYPEQVQTKDLGKVVEVKPED